MLLLSCFCLTPLAPLQPMSTGALQLVCPGFESDNNAVVNVDEASRPLIRMMGHTHGRMIIDCARQVYISRAQEIAIE